jgi:hypothetical protein
VRNGYEEGQQPEQFSPNNLNLHELKRYILAESPRIFRFEIEWAKREGVALEDTDLLRNNIEAMGGDPFQQSNGALQELEQKSYSYGMFNNSPQNNLGFNAQNNPNQNYPTF